MNLWAEGTGIYVDMPLQNVKSRWNCSLLMERMLLIKIFSRIRVDTKKNVASQPSCGEEGFNIAMTMIESEKLILLLLIQILL
jgi:hypothetical protein